jgi:hypothetical protein
LCGSGLLSLSFFFCVFCLRWFATVPPPPPPPRASEPSRAAVAHVVASRTAREPRNGSNVLRYVGVVAHIIPGAFPCAYSHRKTVPLVFKGFVQAPQPKGPPLLLLILITATEVKRALYCRPAVGHTVTHNLTWYCRAVPAVRRLLYCTGCG